MKKLVFAALLILTISCSEKEEPATGCLTGVNGAGDRVLIRCCTKSQYLAGSNVAAGGTANWENYSAHQWETCSNCK